MAEKKVTEYLKLKDNHPTMIKLLKLYDLAEELGISVSFGNYRTIVNDRDRDDKLPPLFIEEVDGGEPVQEWPPVFEFKVIYDNPEYLAKKKAEQEEYDRKRKEESAKKEAEQKAKEQAEAAARARAQEQRERAELARLKAKYND
jgi:multidrug efflux pump subunit AcrA (membrane-fusion protein)